MSLAETLDAGTECLGLSLDEGQRSNLLNYLALLQKWNKVYNLTAVRDPENMLHQHLLDSLAVLPHVVGERLLDMGSGPGLPGIPLAIAAPGLRVSLLDSNQKKCAFQRQATIELGLKNVDVVCARADAFHPVQAYDAVISRAFSELAEFARLAAPLCRPGGMLLAMKGVYPEDELARLPECFVDRRVVALDVPGLEAQRHLVVLGV